MSFFNGAGACAAGLLLAIGAHAATIERLVMPGPVIEGHADIESDCDQCHAVFDNEAQDVRCLGCHEDVQRDLDAGAGFHGLSGSVRERSCRECHTEHQGRDADVVGLNPQLFDHSLTDFELAGGHANARCQGCHAAKTPFRDAPGECVDCHGEISPHGDALDDHCKGCHNPSAWNDVHFDHDETDFVLTGLHRDVACRTCHVGELYADLERTCVACHGLDDVHRGSRGFECESCHNTKGWKTQRFDHEAKTGFALLGVHDKLSCAGCHLADMQREEPPVTCFGCHSFDDVHKGRRGTACDDCHGQQRWDKVTFDHFEETGFVLNGAHRKLTCESCHVGSLTEVLPTTCAECHARDDPHDGTLKDCASCHSETSWFDVRFNHDFTAFPLIGIHRSASCEDCHVTRRFSDAEAECVVCHGDDDYHHGTFADGCALCHNPNGWNRWQFDHDAQTTFALTGSHIGIECASCHRTNVHEDVQFTSKCASCHARDDVHRGRFGSDCDRCHTTESFSDMSGFP